MKAVILAGGLGTRLRPYTKTLPKPMLPLGGKPILEYEIEWLKKNGIKEIVVCVSYLRKKIENYFGDGRKFGIKIEYAISNKPLATAGQLKTAEKFIDELGNPYSLILLDKDGTKAIEWGAFGIPESFLIYQNKILKRYIGPLNNKSVNEIIGQIK